jgi:hypothetical protein
MQDVHTATTIREHMNAVQKIGGVKVIRERLSKRQM